MNYSYSYAQVMQEIEQQQKNLPVFATVVGVAFVDNAKDKNKLV